MQTKFIYRKYLVCYSDCIVSIICSKKIHFELASEPPFKMVSKYRALCLVKNNIYTNKKQRFEISDIKCIGHGRKYQ
jgi:hypothetical protein